MQKQVKYFINRAKEKLWVRPLLFCVVSIGVALLAHVADSWQIEKFVPELERTSLKELLTTISASMLVIAIFAVGSMISAYNAASSTATPRSFSLVIADDVSQNALSVFIGSFIYSVISTIALQNAYFGKTGQFVLLVITLLFFALVIITFLRWVQRIARLGRLEHTIEKIEKAAAAAIKKYKTQPYGGGVAIVTDSKAALAIKSNEIGYVRLVDTEKLQDIATALNITFVVQCLPGKFVTQQDVIVLVKDAQKALTDDDRKNICKAFTIGRTRYFDDDPRFGLIALTEVASRALSPGINDPGTAIAILGSHVRLFALFHQDVEEKETDVCDRVQMPLINESDFFEDAFRPIARDGASNIEVMIRLQKTLQAISVIGDDECKKLVSYHASQAMQRAEKALELEADFEILKSMNKR